MKRSVNVLVVDDDESIRLGCAQVLEAEGYRVSTAADGPSGLEMTSRESFDLVLLDLKLPGLGGMKLLERIRQDNPNTLVIVITGYANIETAVAAMRRGAVDFLPKPFSSETLVTLAERALDRRRL